MELYNMKPQDCNNRNRKLIEFKKGVTKLNLVTFLKRIRQDVHRDDDAISSRDICGLDYVIEELEKLGLKGEV